MKARREVKKKMINLKNEEQNKKVLELLLKFINQCIHKQSQIDWAEITTKAAETIKSNGVNSTIFWNFMKKMDGHKQEHISAMIDENGQEVEEQEQIKKVYQRHYMDLLTQNVAETEREKEVEDIVRRASEARNLIASNKMIKKIGRKEYIEAKRQLKKSKAADISGWKNEFVLNAGKDLDKSIHVMLNEISKTRNIPNTS